MRPRWRWIVETVDGTHSGETFTKRKAKRIGSEVAGRAPREGWARGSDIESSRMSYVDARSHVERVR